ncbi:MAG: NADH-quinone oxidoreductase subunit M, partial [Acidobacteria bacterium]|nr:NADH-quinone oxidoreductase subunit M [Acidobacteriota bacterium]
MNLLNMVLALPVAGFLALLLVPKDRHKTIRAATLSITLLVFLVSLGLIRPVLADTASSHFTTDAVWIATPAIRYHVAVDGLSLWLVILATLLTPIAVLISWRHIGKRVKEFHALLLLLEFGLVGVFVSMDLFLFYVFWEVSLVPMYFLIGVWGHERRIYAAVKFFLYTMAGSVLMLAAMIYLYNCTGTFDYPRILEALRGGQAVLSHREEFWLFLAFFFAFAIKVPLFPLHTWLPDAHVEAPT